jgi:Rieske Fe-S protein
MTDVCTGNGQAAAGDDDHDRGAPRRSVLRGFAALGALGAAGGLLAGCGGDEGASASGGGSAETSAPQETAAGTVLAKAAEIPVGGAKVLSDKKLVISQPSTGEFKAYSAVCTHKGCTVGVGTGLELKCPCHGSAFDAGTGAVTAGPATAPLAGADVELEGDTIVSA